jgi:hypothetical protein
MSAFSGHNPGSSRSAAVARQRRLQHVLQHYGVLTRDSLRELAGAARWQVPFDVVLRRAMRSGRVRRLSEDLFEPGGDGSPH